MDKAREILEQMPDVKIGLDSFYGQQTVLNALNKALNIHNVVGRSEQLSCVCGHLKEKHSITTLLCPDRMGHFEAT